MSPIVDPIGFLLWASLVAQTIKNLPVKAGDPGLIPGSGKTSGKGNGYSFQYSCLENSMDRGAWHSTVHKVTKSQTQFNDFYSLSLMVSAVTTQLFPCKLCSNKTLHKETEI